MSTPELNILAIAIRRLNETGIPYMLTGSVAAGYYAEPRMTRDADLVVELTGADAPRLAAAFGHEFDADADVIARAIERRGMFNLIHVREVVKLDFIVRKDEPFRVEEFRRRRPVLVNGVETFIVSREDLILSKLHWAKDSHSELQMRDVRHLLSAAQHLDLDYLQRWAKHLGIEALLTAVGAP